MRQSLSPGEMEDLARGLQRAWEAALVPLEEFRRLHARFRAQGVDGAAWTVGWRTLGWHRRSPEGWVAGTPPDSLSMDAQALARLRDLVARAGGAPPVTRQLEPPAALALAQAMAAAQAGGADVSALHGHFRLRGPDEGVWTVGLQDLTWYRLREGRWRAGLPPAALRLDGIVAAALERLPRPDARPCPSCGVASRPGSRFCRACGATVGGAAVVDAPPVAPPVVPPVAPPAQAVCAACGSPLRPGRAFCVRCGTPVAARPASPALCPHPACRRPLKPGKKFCVHCGKPV